MKPFFYYIIEVEPFEIYDEKSRGFICSDGDEIYYLTWDILKADKFTSIDNAEKCIKDNDLIKYHPRVMSVIVSINTKYVL